MASTENSMPVLPGRSVGFISLGASLHSILNRLKAEPRVYQSLEVAYSAASPLAAPVIVNLPHNGMRLRFDGPDQRLRLIEVLDFAKTNFTYEGSAIVKGQESSGSSSAVAALPIGGPSFHRICKLFAVGSYSGEYIPSNEGPNGTYILSYPGIAFSFPLPSLAYSPEKDHVALLSSSALPAVSLAVFEGDSWPKARPDLYTAVPSEPRNPISSNGRSQSQIPDEVDLVRIHGEGRVELIRRSGLSFWIILSETTPQDLVAELGPPDAIYRKDEHRTSVWKNTKNRRSSNTNGLSPVRDDMMDTDASSSHTEASDSDEDGDAAVRRVRDQAAAECFFNYFSHGIDVFISRPTIISPPSPTSPRTERVNPHDDSDFVPSYNHLVATKVILHGNVPGTYPFNSHRRCRWTLNHVPSGQFTSALTSEMPFSDISGRLREVYQSSYMTEEEERNQQRAMVLDRGWGEWSEGDASGEWEGVSGWDADDLDAMEGVNDGPSREKRGKSGGNLRLDGESGLGNVKLFGFPGMIFEVPRCGAVSVLTVF